MKVFEIVGSFGDGLMDKRYGLYKVLVFGPDEETEKSFQEKTRQIADELKKKYGAGKDDTPFEKRKSRQEIIDEIAKLLCERFGFTLLIIEGKHTIGGFAK